MITNCLVFEQLKRFIIFYKEGRSKQTLRDRYLLQHEATSPPGISLNKSCIGIAIVFSVKYFARDWRFFPPL